MVPSAQDRRAIARQSAEHIGGIAIGLQEAIFAGLAHAGMIVSVGDLHQLAGMMSQISELLRVTRLVWVLLGLSSRADRRRSGRRALMAPSRSRPVMTPPAPVQAVQLESLVVMPDQPRIGALDGAGTFAIRQHPLIAGIDRQMQIVHQGEARFAAQIAGPGGIFFHALEAEFEVVLLGGT